MAALSDRWFVVAGVLLAVALIGLIVYAVANPGPDCLKSTVVTTTTVACDSKGNCRPVVGTTVVCLEYASPSPTPSKWLR